MRPIRVQVHCRECERSYMVAYTPGSNPIVSGPPEKCDPGSDAEWEPSECPHCAHETEEVDIIDCLPEPPEREDE